MNRNDSWGNETACGTLAGTGPRDRAQLMEISSRDWSPEGFIAWSASQKFALTPWSMPSSIRPRLAAWIALETKPRKPEDITRGTAEILSSPREKPVASFPRCAPLKMLAGCDLGRTKAASSRKTNPFSDGGMGRGAGTSGDEDVGS